MDMDFNIDKLFEKSELIPVITTCSKTNAVLMLAYMNKQSLQHTLDTKKATYYSRSRQKLWIKGETSGHFQDVISICADCDFDTLLMVVKQTGPACHTGEPSCFFNKIL